MSDQCEVCEHFLGDARSTVLRLMAQRGRMLACIDVMVSEIEKSNGSAFVPHKDWLDRAIDILRFEGYRA